MAREPKFTFISEDTIGRKSSADSISYRVSLKVYEKLDSTGKQEAKHVQIIFPGEVIRIYDLEGKHMKFYVDVAKKAIAWRVIEGNTSLDDLNKARVCKIQKNGIWAVSILKMVNAAGLEIKEGRKHIPVKTYDSKDILAQMKFSYIEL